jgi:hypothetical protein
MNLQRDNVHSIFDAAMNFIVIITIDCNQIIIPSKNISFKILKLTAVTGSE